MNLEIAHIHNIHLLNLTSDYTLQTRQQLV